jgi:hypothetical protein
MKIIFVLLSTYIFCSVALAYGNGNGKNLRASNGVAISVMTISNISTIDQVTVSFPEASYNDTRYDGSTTVVLINRCETGSYPRFFEKVLQKTISRTGSYPVMSSAEFENTGFSTAPNCNTEIAVVMNGQWLTDPISNKHNFQL